MGLRLVRIVGLAATLAMLIGLPVGATVSATSPAAITTPSLPSDASDQWSLDEGSGTTLTNAVSGEADGRLSGGTSWVSGHGENRVRGAVRWHRRLGGVGRLVKRAAVGDDRDLLGPRRRARR